MPDAHPRVLHVEDNDFFAKVTADVLDDDYDIDVCTVDSAEAALRRLDDERFTCIVSDYEMPGMDGLEFLEAIRETHPDIPFILLTGGGSERIASEAVSSGVTDYLKKGAGREQFAVLANRIRKAISRQRTERLGNRQIAVNDLIWDVSQAVLRASSREDIERTVRDRLADSEPYVLAWIGNADEETPAVLPGVAAGDDRRHIDAANPDAERDEDRRVPVREAIETRSVCVERATTPETESDAYGNAERYLVAAVPLVYENRTYGVLSVWSDDSCAFGEAERRVLSKFGNSVAYAIDSVRTRKELVRREQRLQVFNRILRHNLRNDLNVVLGRAENIGEQFPSAEPEADVIRQKAGELIEISEKARQVEKTLDHGDRTKKQVDVTDCVERTCAEFRQAYPDAEIVTESPGPVRVYADETLEAAVREVVENAIEHSDGSPSVTVTVSAADDDGGWVELTVVDDGPGIPDEERRVLAEGEETALRHGSGLGLWLTNWIVGKFGGELSFDDDRDGGAVTLQLQRVVEDAGPPEDPATVGEE